MVSFVILFTIYVFLSIFVAMKMRNHAFDFLCGICIIRMVTLHIMSFCGHADDDWWREVMQWTYVFMSFFFFKAGYFNKTVAGDSKAYFIDKSKRLLVPYISCGTIGFLIYMAFQPILINRYHKPIEPLAWDHLWTKSAFYGNNPTWFLFSFWACYIAVHFIEKWTRGLPSWIRVLYIGFPFLSYWMFVLGNPLWMQLNNLFMGIYYFQLGRFWHFAMDRMGRERTLFVCFVMILAFAVSNLIFHDTSYTMSSNTFTGDVFITIANTTIILCGLAGFLIAAHMPRIPGINFIGEHSMVYFVGHYPMLYFYKFTHLCFGRSIFGRWDDVIILIPVIFSLCSWLVPYIESVPWLSGRWPKKEEAIRA